MQKSPSKYLQLKRYRRRLNERIKRFYRRKARLTQYEHNYILRTIGKNIKSYSDAVEYFLPTSLAYVSSCENSPLYVKNLVKHEYKDSVTLTVPKCFSIIENEKESVTFLKEIAEILFWQSCDSFRIDYRQCEYCDLATQVVLDSILKDYDKFIHRCEKAELNRNKIGLNISSIGGNNIHNVHIQRLINSVGSPVVLNNRQYRHEFVEPYKLRYYEADEALGNRKSGQKEIDATTLIEYLCRCMSRLNKKLTVDAINDLGYILGETLSNAEEHSSLHNRYLIGYFEEGNSTLQHYGLLNLVIMNYGKTIYEKFKYPEEGKPFNIQCQERMRELSESFKSRNFFKKDEFSEETLWTLYSLQGGVSCIPPEVKKRGNGTIQFIESFFNIKGSQQVDNVSKLVIWSGKARVDFDGTYHVSETLDENGNKIGIIPFNESGKITEKPDPRYVFSTNTYFPGTMIYARLLINEDDIIKYEK